MSVYVFRSLPYVELVGQKTELEKKKKKKGLNPLFLFVQEEESRQYLKGKTD